MSDLLNCGEVVGVGMSAGGGLDEIGQIAGHYDLVCTDSEGNVLWSDGFDNVVATLGKNQLLASGAGAAGTSFMGLISSSGFIAVSGTDTMTVHAGWLECGGTVNPVYGANRPVLTFGTPTGGSISNPTPTSYVFSTSGTVQGAFIAFGGASAPVNNTGGVLLSAGSIAVPQPVVNGNTVTMTYTLSL